MSVSSQPTASNTPPAKIPGEVVRGLVSLWIIIHFLGILLAVVTLNPFSLMQTPSGGELAQSQLLIRLKQVPPIGHYISGLWFDLPYSYTLANGTEFDGDFALRVDLIDAEGKYQPLNLPADDIWFGERRERLARLALNAGQPADMNNSRMIAQIGKGILKQTGSKEMTLNAYRHQQLTLEDVWSSDALQRDPNNKRTFVRTFTAKVWLNPSGEAEVSVQQEARDVATPNQPSSNSTTPPQKDNPPDSTPKQNTNEGNSTSTPGTTRPAPNRRLADPLPQPERPQGSPMRPPSLFRPTETPADPNELPK